MGTKLSQLPTAGTPADEDLVYLAQGGVSTKTTVADLRTGIAGELPGGGSDGQVLGRAGGGPAWVDPPPAEAAKGYVRHDGDDAVVRPSGFASIEWFGWVTPTNWVDGDTLVLIEEP